MAIGLTTMSSRNDRSIFYRGELLVSSSAFSRPFFMVPDEKDVGGATWCHGIANYREALCPSF